MSSSSFEDSSKTKTNVGTKKKHLKNILKCVVVGDGAAGKTSLLTVYANGKFPTDYLPTVFETCSTDVIVNGKDYCLTLWDTGGQESYEQLRPLSYKNASVIVICYDISRYASFENVTEIWLPETKHFCPGLPVVLVACKSDLRHSSLNTNEEPNEQNNTYTKLNEEQTSKSSMYRNKMVTTAEGEQLAKNIQASEFIETSAKLNENVSTVFITVAELVVKAAEDKRKSRRCCLI